MFGNLSFGEILIIFAVLLLVFGAKRLPEMGASIGKGIREFKKSITEVERSVTQPDRDERIATPPPRDSRDLPSRDEEKPEPKRLLS